MENIHCNNCIDMNEGSTSAQLVLSGLKLATWPVERLAVAGTGGCDSIKDLRIDHNCLVQLPADIGLLTGVQRLSATGNDIKTIHENISQLSNLLQLGLTENCLQHLPDGICELRNLTQLKLMGNELLCLPNRFGELHSLSYLDVSENQLHNLPESFGLLVNLKTLDASNNSLSKLPIDFGSLESLEYLNLSHNELSTLPPSFSNLPSLVILDLTYNAVETLPEHLSSASTLQELHLDENKIEVLPSWIGNMPTLRKFCISNNQLYGSGIPENFGLTSLLIEHLDLSGNSLECLPQSFHNLTCLKFLDMGSVLPELERKAELLNGNVLMHLPPYFGELRNITELRLDENHLVELPEDFGLLQSLEIIDLGQDCLKTLPISFCDLIKLHTCSLAMNCLEELPEQFGNLVNLTWLRLDQNCLTRLPDSFSALVKLEHLDLFYNKLTSFPECLHALTNLKSLNVERNMFKLKDTPNIHKPHSYPTKDPALSDNWRGKLRSDHFPEAGEVHTLANEYSSSDEDDESGLRIPPGYNYFALKRAAEKGLTTWRSHGDQSSADRPIYRSNSPPIQISDLNEGDWKCEENADEENWDSLDEENPYSTPHMYLHPSMHPMNKLEHKFLPAVLHRPSFLYLFHTQTLDTPAIEDGQFDDPEP